jgi:hypothetical protein
MSMDREHVDARLWNIDALTSSTDFNMLRGVLEVFAIEE